MGTTGAVRAGGGSFLMQTVFSGLVLAVGLGLMAFMIITESEPGALPLGMVLVGLVWLITTRVRARSARRLGR